MLERVKAYMQKHHMTQPGDLVIVSVSGGPDSTALLHVLHRLAPDLGLALHVFHMDHALRGAESAEDATYVQSMAERLGLPCTVVRLAPGELKQAGASLEAQAREARHRALGALVERTGARRVALGHNLGDQSETVVLRLLRGAGTQGLAGMRPVKTLGNMTLIRPLLTIPRCDIAHYCNKHELFPRLDSSNLRGDYTRNRIRLQLLPHLEAEYNRAIASNLADLAEIAAAENDLLDELARKAFARCLIPGEGVALNGSVLLNEPLAIARRVVRLAAEAAQAPGETLGLSAVTQVLEGLSRPEGSRELDLPGGLRVRLEYGIAHFDPPAPVPLQGHWALAVPGITRIPELGLRIVVAREGHGGRKPDGAITLDEAKLPGPLAVRLRRPGDRIWPVGMAGSKKLQDILVDAKVPRWLRDRVPVLVAGDEVLWVMGHRVDRRYLAGEAPERPLTVRVEGAGNAHQ